MNPVGPSPVLARVLSRHRETIGWSWARALHARPGTHYHDLSPEELEPWTRRGLDAVIGLLVTGDAGALETHLRRVSRIRRRLGFEIGEVLGGLLVLKSAALPLIVAEHPDDAERTHRAIGELDAVVCRMVARLGQLFATSTRLAVEQERARLALLLEASKAAGASLRLDDVAGCIARFIGESLRAERCLVFMRSGGGGGRPAFASAWTPLADRVPNPERHGGGRGLDSIRDAAVDLGRPVIRRRHQGGPYFETHPGASALAAIPLSTGREVLAVAVAIAESGRFAFDERDLRLAEGIASAIAPAAAHALLYSASERDLRESRSLQRMTSALLDRIGLASVLEIICRETQTLTGANGAAVMLLEARNRLRVVFGSGDAAHGADELLRQQLCADELHLPVEPLLINAPRRARRDPGEPPPVTSMLVVPLRVRDDVVGAMQLVNKVPGFDEDDRRIIESIAEQVAMLIEHDRLHARRQQLAVIEERQRLARDLHDSVTQSVYAASMLAEATARHLESGRGEAARDSLRELRQTALKALREMRHMVFELRPPDVEKLGLAATLRARLAAVESRIGLETHFSCDGADDLPIEVAEALYRIAQEAFANSVRHAQASRIELRLCRDEESVVLEIADDGAGFDPQIGRSKGGLGLQGMEERASRLGGRLSIVSRPGKGTHITVRVPLERPTDEEPVGAAPATRRSGGSRR